MICVNGVYLGRVIYSKFNPLPGVYLAYLAKKKKLLFAPFCRPCLLSGVFFAEQVLTLCDTVYLFLGFSHPSGAPFMMSLPIPVA